MKLLPICVFLLGLGQGFGIQATDVRNGTNCELCLDIIQTLDDAITKPENEQFITELLQGLCEQFPEQQTECEILIEAYYDDIVELIVNLYFLPEPTCTEWGLCP